MRDHLFAKCSMSDRPGLDVRAQFWPETLNPSLIAGTIAEDNYKGNDEVEGGMKFRDSLLGRQVVVRTPLACYNQPLQAS